MPGHLFEGNPVDKGTKRRVTDTPMHHSVKKDTCAVLPFPKERDGLTVQSPLLVKPNTGYMGLAGQCCLRRTLLSNGDTSLSDRPCLWWLHPTQSHAQTPPQPQPSPFLSQSRPAQAPPGSQASSRGEAKDSALLSSRDAGLLAILVSHALPLMAPPHPEPCPNPAPAPAKPLSVPVPPCPSPELSPSPESPPQLRLSYAVRETQVRSLGWEDPLEKEMATHSSTAAAAAKSLQSCPTLCDPRDSPPVPVSLHGKQMGKQWKQ